MDRDKLKQAITAIEDFQAKIRIATNELQAEQDRLYQLLEDLEQRSNSLCFV